MMSSSSPCSLVSARATAWRVTWSDAFSKHLLGNQAGIRAGVYALGDDLRNAQTLA